LSFPSVTQGWQSQMQYRGGCVGSGDGGCWA
jgi:hypothetical protein